MLIFFLKNDPLVEAFCAEKTIPQNYTRVLYSSSTANNILYNIKFRRVLIISYTGIYNISLTLQYFGWLQIKLYRQTMTSVKFKI